MKRRWFNLQFTLATFVCSLLVGSFVPFARAGGPLLVENGQPVRWASGPVTGQFSQTVDAQGRVLYRVDSGTLGPLSNAQAVALVDRIFGLYNGIPTASLKFVNAGAIHNPRNGDVMDVDSSNVGLVLSGANPTFQNPIIFDSDGSITGGGGVLGFFTFLSFGDDNTLHEGAVVLNGSSVDNVGGPIPFGGVFTHEFGHFAGPLDHAQSNGNIANNGEGAVLPPGFNEAQAFDLYAPYTETLYPFLFGAPFTSQLGAQGFDNSGYFIASLDLDTVTAFSTLYPVPGFRANDIGSPNGAIEGSVLIRTVGGDIPITGINVVARRISEGPYPPAPGTTAYPGNSVTVDSNGVPIPPTPRAETDSLSTVVSGVTGLGFQSGAFRFDGLPPGDYLIELQQINPDALGGSGIGPLGMQITLPVPEYYSGASESGGSTDDPASFSPVVVRAGSVTTGIDVILNGFSDQGVAEVSEVEPNEKKKKAQKLNVPALVTGHVNTGDPSRLTIDFGSQGTASVNDLYAMNLDRDTTFFIVLDAVTGSGDIDLYLLDGAFKGKVLPINSGFILASSLSPTTSEFIGVRLPAGKYYLGVSGFSGQIGYQLRVLTTS